jgi:hypothetical protein
MDETYAEVGTQVILREHKTEPWHCQIEAYSDAVQRNWATGMARYIGKKARITSIGRRDGAGCLCCRVDVDGGVFAWRVESMILASDEGLLR